MISRSALFRLRSVVRDIHFTLQISSSAHVACRSTARLFVSSSTLPDAQFSKDASLSSPGRTYSVVEGKANSNGKLETCRQGLEIIDDEKNNAAVGPWRMSSAQKASIALHRNVLSDVLRAVERLNAASSADVDFLRAQLERLSDGLFLLVVVGEYNSGKSSFINAILGRKVVAEGAVPTTDEVTLIRYADEDSLGMSNLSQPDGVSMIRQSIDFLRTISLVDSPGTNAIDRRHEVLTKEYLPKCDYVMFVTSADRPFSESERVFLESIRSWGKKCILVINKIDLLSDAATRDEVVRFVKESSRTLLGSNPLVFPVSSRQAYEAKSSTTGRSGPHWDASGFEALETFLSKNLDDDERLLIKLQSVASSAEAVARKYAARLTMDKAILKADLAAIEDVKTLVQRCQTSVFQGFPSQYAQVDNVLLELIERADAFFENFVTLGNVRMLMRKDAVTQAFFEQVLQGTSRDVERRTRKLAEWVSDKSARNTADAASVFARRLGERTAELIRANMDLDMSTTHLHFPSDVDGLISSEHIVSGLSDAAAELATMYQPDKEGERIANVLSRSIVTLMAVELSAMGLLGTLVGLSLVDPLGLASSGALAAVGLFVLPRQRQLLRSEIRGRVASLRSRLEKELRSRVTQQMSLHTEKVLAAMEPFESSTTKRIETTEAQLKAISKALEDLKNLQNSSRLLLGPTKHH